MVKIEEIPTEELEKDLRESLQDIQACEAGLACGLVEAGGISIQYRLDENKYFVKVITAELERRRTQLAPDKWESPDPTGVVLPLSWDISQEESTPPTCG